MRGSFRESCLFVILTVSIAVIAWSAVCNKKIPHAPGPKEEKKKGSESLHPSSPWRIDFPYLRRVGIHLLRLCMVKVGADFKFIALEDASCRLPESANSLKSVPFITLSLVASKKTSGSKEAMNSTRCNSTTCFSSSCCLWFSSNLGIGWVSVFKGRVMVHGGPFSLRKWIHARPQLPNQAIQGDLNPLTRHLFFTSQRSKHSDVSQTPSKNTLKHQTRRYWNTCNSTVKVRHMGYQPTAGRDTQDTWHQSIGWLMTHTWVRPIQCKTFKVQISHMTHHVVNDLWTPMLKIPGNT